jgi:hypothetical protein
LADPLRCFACEFIPKQKLKRSYGDGSVPIAIAKRKRQRTDARSVKRWLGESNSASVALIHAVHGRPMQLSFRSARIRIDSPAMAGEAIVWPMS